jgi:hypothetical protein
MILLSLTATAAAQKETAKFNNNGDLIRISGLLEDKTGCEPSRTVIGRITKMTPLRGDNADSFEFSLKPAAGSILRVVATISHDAGAVLVDLENLLQPNRRVKVKARACGSSAIRTVEEITRL